MSYDFSKGERGKYAKRYQEGTKTDMVKCPVCEEIKRVLPHFFWVNVPDGDDPFLVRQIIMLKKHGERACLEIDMWRTRCKDLLAIIEQ